MVVALVTSLSPATPSVRAMWSRNSRSLSVSLPAASKPEKDAMRFGPMLESGRHVSRFEHGRDMGVVIAQRAPPRGVARAHSSTHHR